MHALLDFVRFFLHIDTALSGVIQKYDVWTHLILFIVVFCETGLVVAPLLPGDSLLFAAGAFAAKGDLRLGLLFWSLTLAGVLGDAVNYAVGRWMGPKVFQKEDSRIFKKSSLDRTHAFFEAHGGKAIIFARFVPIVRTFAPFVAGVGAMGYGKFAAYNVSGAVLWVTLGLLSGYFFGNLPVVKENFTLVLLAIVVISVLPAVIETLRHRRKNPQP
jgi:membrane-associated protein